MIYFLITTNNLCMKQCLITSHTLRVYLEVTATKSNNITFFTYVESKRTYRYLGDQSIRQSKYI